MWEPENALLPGMGQVGDVWGLVLSAPAALAYFLLLSLPHNSRFVGPWKAVHGSTRQGTSWPLPQSKLLPLVSKELMPAAPQRAIA